MGQRDQRGIPWRLSWPIPPYAYLRSTGGICAPESARGRGAAHRAAL